MWIVSLKVMFFVYRVKGSRSSIIVKLILWPWLECFHHPFITDIFVTLMSASHHHPSDMRSSRGVHPAA